MRPAPDSSASRTWSRVSHSTSSGSAGAAARTAAIAAAIPPAAAMWLSLMSAASPSPIRWLRPPPHRTAYFSSWRSPGVVLRVSRTVQPVPDRASAQAPGGGGDPGQVGEEVEQGPFGPEQLAHRGGDADQLGAGLDPVTVGAQRLGRLRRDPGGVQDGEGDRDAGQHAGLAGYGAGHGARIRRGGGGRGDIGPVPQVLRQRAAHGSLGVVGVQARGEQLLGHHRVQGHSRAPTFALAVPVTRGRPSSTCTMVWRAGLAGSAGPGGGWSRHR